MSENNTPTRPIIIHRPGQEPYAYFGTSKKPRRQEPANIPHRMQQRIADTYTPDDIGNIPEFLKTKRTTPLKRQSTTQKIAGSLAKAFARAAGTCAKGALKLTGKACTAGAQQISKAWDNASTKQRLGASLFIALSALGTTEALKPKTAKIHSPQTSISKSSKRGEFGDIAELLEGPPPAHTSAHSVINGNADVSIAALSPEDRRIVEAFRRLSHHYDLASEFEYDESYTFDGHNVDGEVYDALHQAAYTYGVPVGYIFLLAQRESSFDPDAKNQHSKAEGLGQFLLPTAMETFYNGSNIGFEHLNGSIRRVNGEYTFANGMTENKFRAHLRDPYFSAMLMAKYTRAKCQALHNDLKDALPNTTIILNSTHCYMTHFAGQTGAKRIIQAALTSPDRSIADFFSKGAEKRNPLLYKKGTIRTDENGLISSGTFLTVTEYIDRIANEKGFGTTPVTFESQSQIANRAPGEWHIYMADIFGNPPQIEAAQNNHPVEASL